MATPITALEIAERADLLESTLELLDKDQRPTLLLDWLLDEERYMDAIRFMSHGLPARYAIWWACLGLLLADQPAFSEAEEKVLAGCARWVIEPADEHRTAVNQAGATLKSGRPVHLLSLALGAADESAPSKTCGDCVAGALINAALRGKPEQTGPKYHMFLALAVAILQGKYLWPELKPASGRPGVPKTAVAH